MAKNYRIIHLDDNPLFISLMEMLIDDEINEIKIKYNGVFTDEEAYNLIESKPPDLFISDLMLEDDHNAETGITVIETLHNNYPSLKIMVLSARGDASLRDRLEKSIVAYKTKEFDPPSLADDIKSILTGEVAHE
jgi:CheY-like chemotaxis protein